MSWPAGTGHEPHFVIIRICSCGTVSLRNGSEHGDDAVSLTPLQARPLMDAISAAFLPGTTDSAPGCFDCLGSLVTRPRPAPSGEVT